MKNCLVAVWTTGRKTVKVYINETKKETDEKSKETSREPLW
jgi:hypothetical protein